MKECFQLLKPRLKAKYVRSVQHTKNTAEEQTRMYKTPDQFRRYQCKRGAGGRRKTNMKRSSGQGESMYSLDFQSQ